VFYLQCNSTLRDYSLIHLVNKKPTVSSNTHYRETPFGDNLATAANIYNQNS
jgi:hypothetical protein